jgi:hypothetical protein
MTFLVVGALLAFLGATEPTRALTFEQRVAAEEALQRVHYSHQVGTTEPFETAVPRKVLEDNVRRYLRESAAIAAHGSQPRVERISRTAPCP